MAIMQLVSKLGNWKLANVALFSQYPKMLDYSLISI